MGNFESIEWPYPYHNYILLIVLRFSFLVEDLVVGCNDVTELGRVVCVAFGIASAKNSCNLLSLAHVTT